MRIMELGEGGEKAVNLLLAQGTAWHDGSVFAGGWTGLSEAHGFFGRT